MVESEMQPLQQKNAHSVTTLSSHITPNSPNRRGNDKKEEASAPISSAKVCLAFSLAFFPILAIPTLLLVLVTVGKVPHVTNNGTDALNIVNTAPSGNYYTTAGVSAGQFALVASWASTIMGNISAPFLILFSFLIARSMSRRKEDGMDTGSKERIREILHSRSYMRLWKWIRTLLPWKNKTKVDEASYITIAGFGFTLLYTALVIAGDNWLHNVVGPATYRYYTDPYYPVLTAEQSNSTDPNSPSFPYASGYTPIAQCEVFLNGVPSPSNQPCSLNYSRYFNLADPFSTYLLLESGVTSTATYFGGTDFNTSLHSQFEYTQSGDQVVTWHNDSTGSDYSFLFWLNGAYQSSDGDIMNDGFDYTAPTHAMQTNCTAADSPCNLRVVNDSTFYDCSSSFSGELSTPSTSGIFRIPNWNTSFYKMVNGTPQEITTYEDQNPFLFNVTVQINNVSDSSMSSNESLPSPLIQTENGSVALALSCQSTVYNVNYTLLDGSITSFETQIASPRLAAIVRAPLQVGFGRYNLYQETMLAVFKLVTPIDPGDPPLTPFTTSVSRTFSQVAIALSRGAFDYTTNIVQRERWDMQVTQVPKAAVWFLAVLCAAYAFFVAILFGVVMWLRREMTIRTAQSQLGLQNVNDIAKENLRNYLDDVDETGEDFVQERRDS